MVGKAVAAAHELSNLGFGAEVIDLRTLVPKSPVRRLARTQRQAPGSFAAPSVRALVEAARELMITHVASRSP